jgi:hypothetical protein
VRRIPAVSTISVAINSPRDITNRNQPLLFFHMDPTNSILWTRESLIGSVMSGSDDLEQNLGWNSMTNPSCHCRHNLCLLPKLALQLIRDPTQCMPEVSDISHHDPLYSTVNIFWNCLNQITNPLTISWWIRSFLGLMVYIDVES